jgi:hypothetical protein
VDATIWHSGFDPIGRYTFSGSGTFQFDDGCLAANGSLGATYCHLQLLGASLNLTDNATGNAAQLSFGPQLINALPRNPIQPGAALAGVLNDTSGPSAGLSISSTVTLGAQQGSGLFSVSALNIVASTAAISSLSNEDLSNLFFDPSTFELTGVVTCQFTGQHGGIHNCTLTFNPDGTWTFDDLTKGTEDTGTYAFVVSLNIEGGVLTGLNTGLIGPVSVIDDTNSLFGPWWLEWQAGVIDPVSLSSETCDGGSCSMFVAGTDTVVRFDEVSGPGLPEPATLTLVLGSACAAWLARRRSRSC